MGWLTAASDASSVAYDCMLFVLFFDCVFSVYVASDDSRER